MNAPRVVTKALDNAKTRGEKGRAYARPPGNLAGWYKSIDMPFNCPINIEASGHFQWLCPEIPQVKKEPAVK